MAVFAGVAIAFEVEFPKGARAKFAWIIVGLAGAACLKAGAACLSRTRTRRKHGRRTEEGRKINGTKEEDGRKTEERRKENGRKRNKKKNGKKNEHQRCTHPSAPTRADSLPKTQRRVQ